jgi:hypothetical protein
LVEARGDAGLLKIHPEVDQVDDDLDVTPGLHATAHDAEGRVRDAVGGEQRRDDRVEGPLAGRENVGVDLLEGEESAAIPNAETDLDRQGVSRGHHAVLGVDHRPGGERASDRAISRRARS